MICHGKPLLSLNWEQAERRTGAPTNLKFTGFACAGQSLRGREVPSGQPCIQGGRIHGIGVDATIAKRYSVPILGKYLVIIANPVEHPMHAQFPVPLPCQNLTITDLIGGHFSA
jgi:hypothetical protein